MQIAPWNVRIPRISRHIRISKSHHGILQYQKPTMGCYDARITPWNTTILKNHHGILQNQNNNIIQSISMHKLDTNFNFDINQPDNSHTFSRGEFTSFHTNIKLIYVSYFFHNSI
jgi:hypothetical protein